MKMCEICQTQEACVEVKRIENGTVQEISLCHACAEAKGVEVSEHLAALLLDGEPSPLAQTAQVLAGSEKAKRAVVPECPACGMSVEAFRRTGRVGCGVCYQVWQALLDPMLLGMHRSLVYAGNVPRERAADPETLQQELEAAIEREDYEEAAVLRDQLRAWVPSETTQEELPF